MQFKVGDVVCLKSGGPGMTIDEVDGGHVHCVWFDGPRRAGGVFAMAVLQLVK